MTKVPPVRRLKNGRFVATRCDDQNCDGILQFVVERHFGEQYPTWQCDGLTHRTDDGPLEACGRSFDAGVTP